MSSIENEERLIVSEVMAKLNMDTSDHHADMRVPGSDIIPASSPTPIAPSSSTTSSSYTEESNDTLTPTNMQQQQVEGDDKMDITSIGAAKAVHTIWADNTPGDFDIFTTKRDGADHDPTTINISNNAGTSSSPAIAVSGNNVHVVWHDTTPGSFDIFYKRSSDGGATFSPTINLSDNTHQSTRPAIAVSGNNVYVVWDDSEPGNFDIFYRRSTNGGASFTEPIKNLSNSAGISFRPAIAVSGNNIHVVWQDDTGQAPTIYDILYRRSTDGGTTFPNVIKNLSSNAGVSEFPAIATSGSNVHVVWDDGTSGNFDILYRRSTDGGTTFPNVIKNLSDNVGPSQVPAIAVSGNNVHVVWVDSTSGNVDILYRRSMDGGIAFTDPIKNLSSNTGFSSEPAISLSSNNIYVVWEDETTSPATEILYRTSSDNGATFPSLLTNLSVNAEDSGTPSIAAS